MTNQITGDGHLCRTNFCANRPWRWRATRPPCPSYRPCRPTTKACRRVLQLHAPRGGLSPPLVPGPDVAVHLSVVEW